MTAPDTAAPDTAASPALPTVYVSIGNSDDRLTQAQWSRYAEQFVQTVRRHAVRVHGEWFSAPTAPWQNACVAFEIDLDGQAALRRTLTALRAEFHQDSIAWAVVRDQVEFV
ncbi:hypothetical protein [Saccharothrix sp. HUAS TT1]|uniref:hypothetical protein n=1 Tax=unclassified Saccharothrix TaxID=2593673 RepID=UPI00345BF903